MGIPISADNLSISSLLACRSSPSAMARSYHSQAFLVRMARAGPVAEQAAGKTAIRLRAPSLARESAGTVSSASFLTWTPMAMTVSGPLGLLDFHSLCSRPSSRCRARDHSPSPNPFTSASRYTHDACWQIRLFRPFPQAISAATTVQYPSAAATLLNARPAIQS